MVLVRRAEQWAATFAARRTYVFGAYEDALGSLEGERRSAVEVRTRC
jgi:hypothetical protein